MLEFRLRQPFAFPFGRQPRLNRLHPLFSQQHIIAAVVPNGKTLVDLVTGQVASGTTTQCGTDNNGPYIYSNDTVGTSACSFPGNSSTFQFITLGCIFKILNASGRSYPWETSNTGWFLVGQTMETVVNNGNWFSVTLTLGHTYFSFVNNSVGTASGTKTVVYVDLDTGQVFMARAASTGNVVTSPVIALNPYSNYLSTIRLYAAFVTGSILIPPAVQPAAMFGSIDQIMAGLANPWSLWYA